MLENTLKGLIYIQELNQKNFEVLLKKLVNDIHFKEWTLEKEKELTQDKAMVIETINSIEKNLDNLNQQLQTKRQEKKIDGKEKETNKDGKNNRV